MCKYRVLKTMKQNGTLKAALNTGIVSSNDFNKMKIYEYCIKLRSKYDKPVAITITSDELKVSENLVYKVLKDFGC